MFGHIPDHLLREATHRLQRDRTFLATYVNPCFSLPKNPPSPENSAILESPLGKFQHLGLNTTPNESQSEEEESDIDHVISSISLANPKNLLTRI